MSGDVDAALDALERRLRAIEEEAGLAGGAGDAPAPEPPARRDPPPAAPPAPETATADDPLERFGAELRRVAVELVAAWDRVAEQVRTAAPQPPPRARELVLETQTGLTELAALERALAASPGIARTELRAYAAGRASLRVEFS